MIEAKKNYLEMLKRQRQQETVDDGFFFKTVKSFPSVKKNRFGTTPSGSRQGPKTGNQSKESAKLT